MRSFSHLHEAHLACSALHAAGIEAVVDDANIVAADWLYSNAVGGVKVLVHPDDADAAREILESTAVVQKNEQHELTATPSQSCPHCGSHNIAPVTRGKRIAVFTWLLARTYRTPRTHRTLRTPTNPNHVVVMMTHP